MSYIDPSNPSLVSPLTISHFQKMRVSGEKITVLTAYDSSFAALFDQAGIEIILVGDSLGNVIQGHKSTIPVTINDVAYHTSCVARAIYRAFLISDMPFASYGDATQATKNAAQLMQAGAHMIKLEGGLRLVPIISHLVDQGIPVCAHLGLTPQSVNTLGGFKVQGKSQESADLMLSDAIALEKSGAQMLVLEAIPSALGKKITEALKIPTIGIGAGPDCSGQVLVMHDALGAFPGRQPKFVKNFLTPTGSIDKAIKLYIDEVKAGTFPAIEHCFKSS
ncbi:MAG: 3-methyl-2-oxobutanoate hydroxymethyltransferase [Betaproteobacteria bacterium]